MKKTLVSACIGCGLAEKCPLFNFKIGENRGVVTKCNFRRVFEGSALPHHPLDKTDVAVVQVYCYSDSRIVKAKKGLLGKLQKHLSP